MDREGFRQLLRERQVPEDQLDAQIALAERFEAFAGGPPAPGDVRAFAAILVDEALNTWDNLVTLVRYAHFTKNVPAYVAAVELLDGSEALEGLYEKLGQAVGEELRDQVFSGIELPPLGTPSTEKPVITQAIMTRLEQLVDPETCRQVLSSGLRHLEDAWYAEERAKYAESGSVDAYLARKGDDLIAQLNKIKDEGGLYFTQPITDEVIAFVERHPEIRQGVRDGNVIYEAKIPYMTVEYLAETDEQMKCHYYCHCPWVRESLRSADVRVSPTFCLCSAGFHKKAGTSSLARNSGPRWWRACFRATPGARWRSTCRRRRSQVRPRRHCPAAEARQAEKSGSHVAEGGLALAEDSIGWPALLAVL